MTVTSDNLLAILSAVGAAQGFVSVSLILAVRGAKERPRRLLALLVALYALTFVDTFLQTTGLYATMAGLWGFALLAYLLIGPALYFYVSAVMVRLSPEPQRLIRHLIIPVLALLLLLPFFLASGADQLIIMQGLGIIAPPQTGLPQDLPEMLALVALGPGIVLLLFFVQSLYYILRSLSLLRWHLDRTRDFFSNIEDISLDWLRYLVIGLLLLWTGSATTEILLPLIGHQGGFELVFPIGEMLVLYVLTLRGVRQAGVALSAPNPVAQPVVEEEAVPELSGAAKYAKSALDDERMIRIAEKLRLAMERDRLYENSALTLRDLCLHIGASQNYVSQTLSQQLNTKFFDYVAAYRVEAAKRLMSLHGDDRTILDIAMEVGFNSKSTFNAAFKRVTGETPSRYRQQRQQAA